EPAERLRGADRVDLLPAAVAQVDGSPGAGALRWRHHPGQCATAPAREGAGPLRGRGIMAAYRCPGCDYVYDESNGAVREGLWESPAAGTRWNALPEGWGCPDCAVREKPDFEILEVTK